MYVKGIIQLILALAVLSGGASIAQEAEPPEYAVGQMPPRLSLVDGQELLWRSGAPDWVQA